MADKKITQLTNITGADLVDADEFVVVDISADETKAITLGELKEAFDSGSGFVRITGDTMTGDLALSGADVTFGDNDKAIFGAGSDLQIWHSGAKSYIRDEGTGDFVIGTNGSKVEIFDYANSNTLANLYTGGAVELYYNGDEKLATSATGIDVTGTILADGLTVQATSGSSTGVIRSAAGSNSTLYLDTQDTTSLSYITVSGSLGIATGSGTPERMRISNNGDINFYATDGTTPAFHWDAADESLGIGTSSPSDILELTAGSSNFGLLVNNASGNPSRVTLTNSEGSGYIDQNNNTMRFNQSGSVDVTIDSSGNVGIGESLPAYKLQLSNTTDTDLAIIAGKNSGDFASIVFGDTDYPAEGRITYQNSDNAMRFWANRSQAMMIDSSGNVLVGKPAVGYATDGFEARAAGYASVSDTDTTPFLVNRNGTGDGNLIAFYKAGGAVGSIGTFGGDAYFGTGDTGLIAYDNGNAILPFNTATGAYADNSLDFGVATQRFKDLYLSGGVVFGDAGGSGTSTSNSLDSYEEGTWTPTFETGTATTIGQATYTKIGRSVTLCVENLKPSDTTSSNVLKVQSLPFAPALGAGGSIGSIMAQYRDNDIGIACYIPNNFSEIRMYYSSYTGGFNSLTHADMFNNSAGTMYFTITYFTT